MRIALLPVEYVSVCSVEIHTHLHCLVNGICFIYEISSSILFGIFTKSQDKEAPPGAEKKAPVDGRHVQSSRAHTG